MADDREHKGVRLKVTFTTEVPTDKGHDRRQCCFISWELQDLETAEGYAAKCMQLLEQFPKFLAQLNAEAQGTQGRIIVPGGVAG